MINRGSTRVVVDGREVVDSAAVESRLVLAAAEDVSAEEREEDVGSMSVGGGKAAVDGGNAGVGDGSISAGEGISTALGG